MADWRRDRAKEDHPFKYGRTRKHGNGGNQRVGGKKGGVAKKTEPAKQFTGSPALGICAICGRQGRGFGYCRDLMDTFPYYDFCSQKCQDLGSILAANNRGILMAERLTDLEVNAIKAARCFLAKALEKNGLMPAFFNCTPEQIDEIINACWSGCRHGMQMAELRREIPFETNDQRRFDP